MTFGMLLASNSLTVDARRSTSSFWPVDLKALILMH